MLKLSDLPSPKCSIFEALKFASRYNGYERIALEPETLAEMYRPIQDQWERSGQLPEWMGIDLLRGLLFLLFREHHFRDSGYGNDLVLMKMRQVIDGLRVRLAEEEMRDIL